MKEPKEFRPQLPQIVRSAFRNQKAPEPSDPVVEQLADIVVALLEKQSSGNPVPSAAPLALASQLVDSILDARPGVAQALRDQNQPVPGDAGLVELAAQQVIASVA